MKKIFSKTLIVLSINLIVLVSIYIGGNISFVERIGNIINDTFTYKINYPTNSHDESVVIIKIDDRTLDTLGKSDLSMTAFDKGVYADVIEKILTQYKASVVGIDVVFANPSVLGLNDEQKLADVFDTYKEQIVIASRSDYKPIPLCLYSNVQHGIIDIPSQDIFRKLPILSYEYDISSYCENQEIYEGNISSVSLFPREILDLYIPKASPFKKEEIANNISLFDAPENRAVYMDYYSDGKQHEGTFGYTSYSFIDIYNGALTTPEGNPIDLSRKIVLIGEVGTLIQDSHFTPVDHNNKMPGVEIYANIISTMLEGRILKDAPVILEIFFFFVLCIIISASVFLLRMWTSLCVLALSILCIIVFGFWFFTLGSLYNIFVGILGLFLTYAFTYIYRFRVSDKAKRDLKKQFSLYVSPDVVNEITENPESILLKGEKRDMTIFFSDIVSFTSISEKIDPELLVMILNEYFSEMTRIVHNNKGTLDKYIGDSVMCFFNAPLKQENHSFFACKTAIEQQQKLRELNTVWTQRGYPEIKIRIGIHSGEAIHGNIGNVDTRVSYTVIGDSVNLASRLEGICKEYGVFICVSEAVYELQKEMFHFRELDTIAVKGKEEAVKIYQLIGFKNIEIPEKNQVYFRNYAQALEYYRSGDYKTAGEIWIKNKNDPSSFHMAQRCYDALHGKVQIEQGVFQMKTK